MAKSKRDKVRAELENLKSKLEVVADVQVEVADLREAERLCIMI